MVRSYQLVFSFWHFCWVQNSCFDTVGVSCSSFNHKNTCLWGYRSFLLCFCSFPSLCWILLMFFIWRGTRNHRHMAKVRHLSGDLKPFDWCIPWPAGNCSFCDILGNLLAQMVIVHSMLLCKWLNAILWQISALKQQRIPQSKTQPQIYSQM